MHLLFRSCAVLFFVSSALIGWRLRKKRRDQIIWVALQFLLLGGWFALWSKGNFYWLAACMLSVWLLTLGSAYILGWRLPAGRLTGWSLHLCRGLICAVIVGPLAAVRYAEMYSVVQWLIFLRLVGAAEWRHYLLYGVPGWLLVFVVVTLCSLGIAWRAGALPHGGKRAAAALILVLLPLLNWYAAGMVDVYDSVYYEHYGRIAYVLACRPGTRQAGDFYGANLMHFARTPEMVRQLHELGVDTDVKLRRGWNAGRTPLHVAANAGQLALVEELIRCGADVDSLDVEHWTPLVRATHENRLEEMKCLIRAGASVESADLRGNTALHWAAVQGNSDAAAVLLESGARLDVRNIGGHTPAEMTPAKASAAVKRALGGGVTRPAGRR